MSAQKEIWHSPQQGSWDICPRYNIRITGCSRHFVCKEPNGMKLCYEAFPKQNGTNVATLPKSIKQIGFRVKQKRFSVKITGV